MEQTDWLELMNKLRFEPNLKTYAELCAHYNQKHRHYHNMSHLRATLQTLRSVKHLALDADAIALALCFHDAIYRVFSSSNELDSANWSSDFLRENQASAALISKVHGLIMATEHTAKPTDSDQQLIVDIDLAILGCDSDLYAQFEQWVRQEYRLIPRFIYNKKRKAILQSFLDRKTIYSHRHFIDRLEQPARTNLQRAIAQL